MPMSGQLCGCSLTLSLRRATRPREAAQTGALLVGGYPEKRSRLTYFAKLTLGPGRAPMTGAAWLGT